MERTDAFTIQPRILGKALHESSISIGKKERKNDTGAHPTNLANQQWHVPLHKVPHRPRVPIEVPARKALVSTVEEDVVSLLERNIRDRLPLLARGVHARRVVRTRVDEEHRPVGRGPERVREAGVVEADRRWVVVRVSDRLDPDVPEDRKVVDF